MNEIAMPRSAAYLVESLRMTNTGTSVFIEILVLSGSYIAETDREKEFVIWLAQRDQNIVGRGTVGFDLDEMPWLEHDLEPMKQFTLRMIDGARKKTQWQMLDYEPSEDWCHVKLDHFSAMIQAFDQSHVDEQQYIEWTALDEEDEYEPTIPVGYPKCVQHDVYLSCLGCVICNSKKGEDQ
ncbi:hypothetical protein MH215_18965 [Paenibacillus sp. ACRSA]|uniref:hypothetical protein n=1 Tax=Paenibacillus sp. ACRSA TaxID=2918211 RepID=UPI001EF621C8|nr:hypothetical protein [Paenibacillus sp. ACRSA]MCG7379099.1 hypothetical protein [Paenibacillus sp. ACRSA]